MIDDRKQAKTALITGAGRRIGAAIARKLHDSGWQVIVHCFRSAGEAEQLSGAFNAIRPDSALTLVEDLNQPGAGVRLIEKTAAWGKGLHALINNASLFIRSDELCPDNWDKMFTVNVRAPFELSWAARSLLTQSRGSIINLGDIHGSKPLKGYSVYCQTKAALLMQTQALAREFAPFVRVNAVSPGAILWPEEDNALNETTKRHILDKIPLQTHGKPEFIADAVSGLLENPYITGQNIKVDGGRSLT